MRFSVALATYNGARFVRRQIESIGTQTRPAGELIVADDGSTDDTPAIVVDEAARHGLPVVLLSPSDRLGPTKNFERAIRACTGDVIVLCDQDDEWRADKLEAFGTVLDNRPQVLGAFSNGIVIDAAGTPTGTTLWQSVSFDADALRTWRNGDALSTELKRNVVVGATLGFRATARELLLPFPDAGWHDYWIALLLGARQALEPIDLPLIRYRAHEANVSGLAEQRGPRALLARVEQARNLAGVVDQTEALLSRVAGLPDVRAADLDRIRDRRDHLVSRLNLPASRARRIAPVLRELRTGRYSRYSQGGRSVAIDLLGQSVRDQPGAPA